MKKPLLILFVFAAISAQAQLEKGAKLVGLQTNLILGDIYATNLTLDIGSNGSTYGINLVPTFGWAIQQNWVVGGQATLGFLREKIPYTGGGGSGINKYYDLGIAPFTRLYLDISRNKKWKVFGMASAELASTQIRYFTEGTQSPGLLYTSSNTQLKGSLGVGLAYFGKRTSIDLNAAVTGLRLGVYRVIRAGKK